MGTIVPIHHAGNTKKLSQFNNQDAVEKYLY